MSNEKSVYEIPYKEYARNNNTDEWRALKAVEIGKLDGRFDGEKTVVSDNHPKYKVVINSINIPFAQTLKLAFQVSFAFGIVRSCQFN
ncbi:MAG: hypothetical protein VW867_00040 [Gammaproteobacteria bacterium]|jgi:hypothetical protein